MLPTTLQMAMLRAPFFLASRRAARVSAVSPDCVMTMASVFFEDDRVAVAVLETVVDVDRRAPATRSGTCPQGRRARRPARQNDHALDRPQHVVGDLDLLQEHFAASSDARPRTVPDRDRLFEDLLEHEVLESRLFGHDGIDDTRVLFFETAPPA